MSHVAPIARLTAAPFLYKKLCTPESVYFQVFVRPVGAKAGKIPAR